MEVFVAHWQFPPRGSLASSCSRFFFLFGVSPTFLLFARLFDLRISRIFRCDFFSHNHTVVLFASLVCTIQVDAITSQDSAFSLNFMIVRLVVCWLFHVSTSFVQECMVLCELCRLHVVGSSLSLLCRSTTSFCSSSVFDVSWRMLCQSDSALVVATSLAAVFSLVFQDCAVQGSHQHLARVCFCSQASRDKDHVSTRLLVSANYSLIIRPIQPSHSTLHASGCSFDVLCPNFVWIYWILHTQIVQHCHWSELTAIHIWRSTLWIYLWRCLISLSGGDLLP